MRGERWVSAGCLWMFVFLVVCPCLLPPHLFVGRRQPALTASCMSNLKQLSNAMLRYASAHHGRLPPAASWQQAIVPYLASTSSPWLFHCPSDETPGRVSYAMNDALAGRDVASVSQPEATLLLFEAAVNGPVAAGGASMLASPPRHWRGSGSFGCPSPPRLGTYAFLHGHVRAMPAPPSFAVVRLPARKGKPAPGRKLTP